MECVNVTKPGHVKRFLLATKELKEKLKSKVEIMPQYVSTFSKNVKSRKNVKVSIPPPKPVIKIDEEFIETPKKKKKKVKVFHEESEEGRINRFSF